MLQNQREMCSLYNKIGEPSIICKKLCREKMKHIYKRGKLCYTKTEPKDTGNREVLPMRFTETIRKIDVHAHATAFHDYYPPHKNGYVFVSPEEVLAMYDQIGIEKGVLLPLAACEAQMAPMTLAWVTTAALVMPFRIMSSTT